MKLQTMKTIEPAVVKLTSDETRMLMESACNPKGMRMRSGGSGILSLGLIVPVKSNGNEKTRLKRDMEQAQARVLAAKTWKQQRVLMEAYQKAEQAHRYYTTPTELFVLTEAGRKLVASITIRRR